MWPTGLSGNEGKSVDSTEAIGVLNLGQPVGSALSD
jgi:hypothetical protein